MKGDSERGTRRKSALGLGDTLDPMTASGEIPELGDRRSRPTVLPRLESVAGHSRIIVDGRPRYEQIETLGSGGIGVVELARDNDIGRKVAVKRLLPEASSPTDLLRFAEEVRTVGLLEHPNITPIHDVGVDDAGAYFFVMKHVEGMTLEAIIQRLATGDADTHARYTFEARTRIFLGIVQALAFAHAKGVVHRDVKPANVMIGACGEVMLVDWGLSTRGTSAIDRPDTIVGTPAYMAPEQAYGAEKGDERSDIYSACVLFYELLTLRHYLPDPTNVLETLSAVETHEPVPARFVVSPHQTNVPPELSFFVAKGMKKDASERYQSVTEMLEALAAIHRGDIRAQCPRTFLKRMTFRAMHFSDAHAATSLILTVLAILVFVCGIASVAMWLMSILA